MFYVYIEPSQRWAIKEKKVIAKNLGPQCVQSICTLLNHNVSLINGSVKISCPKKSEKDRFFVDRMMPTTV